MFHGEALKDPIILTLKRFLRLQVGLCRVYCWYMGHRVPRPPTVNMLCAHPLDVRASLKAQASRNLVPMSSVKVSSIRKVMQAEQRDTSRADHPLVGVD
jgi:hypothetical protein